MYLRYTGTEKFGTFGMISIPVPRTSVRSVRGPYRYREVRYVRYAVRTGTGGAGTTIRTGNEMFGMFGMISIPVPRSSVRSVRGPYRYREVRYVRYVVRTGTEHTGSSVRCSYRYRAYTSTENTGTGMIGKLGMVFTRYRHTLTAPAAQP